MRLNRSDAAVTCPTAGTKTELDSGILYRPQSWTLRPWMWRLTTSIWRHQFRPPDNTASYTIKHKSSQLFCPLLPEQQSYFPCAEHRQDQHRLTPCHFPADQAPHNSTQFHDSHTQLFLPTVWTTTCDRHIQHCSDRTIMDDGRFEYNMGGESGQCLSQHDDRQLRVGASN